MNYVNKQNEQAQSNQNPYTIKHCKESVYQINDPIFFPYTVNSDKYISNNSSSTN
jgi:hypothetical protein